MAPGLNPFSAALARLRCFTLCLKKLRGDEISEDADDLLRYSNASLFLGAVLESAPQFIIQLYAMSVQQEPVQIIQMISLPVSFFGIAWASAVMDETQTVPNIKHKLLFFVTQMFLLSSRLFAIGFFIVSYKWWIISVLMIHSLVIVTTDTILFCRIGGDCRIGQHTRNKSHIVGSALGYAIFSFFFNWLRDDSSSRMLIHESSAEGKTLRMHLQLFSNALFVVENVAIIILFYFSEFSNNLYSLPVTVCVCLFSVLGAIIRVTHNRFLTKERQLHS